MKVTYIDKTNASQPTGATTEMPAEDYNEIKDVINTNDDIATPLSVAYSTNVRADRTRFKSKFTMAGAVALTLDTTLAIVGLGETIQFVGDGNNITISGGTIVPSQNATIATEAGIELLLVLVWGGSYWQVGVEGQLSTGGITTPVLSLATVESVAATDIVLTYDIALDESSVPAITDFVASGGKAVSSVAISGQVVTVAVDSAYISNDTITIDYTGGTNKIKTVAGGIAADLTTQAVTNNIDGIIVTDDFPGTSFDANKWTFVFPNTPSPTLRANDGFEHTSLDTAADTGSYDDYIRSIKVMQSGEFSFSADFNTGIPNHSGFRIRIIGSLGSIEMVPDSTGLMRTNINSTIQTHTAAYGYRWKFHYNETTGMVYLSRWDTSVWTEVYSEIDDIGSDIGIRLQGQNQSGKVGTGEIGRVRLSSYLHSTELP